jgi:CBS domain-containing protein
MSTSPEGSTPSETKPESDAKSTPPEAASASAAAPEAGGETELEPAGDGPPPVPKARPAADDTPAPGSVTGKLPASSWPPKTVTDVMTRQVITLQESEPIGDLESSMKHFRFRHLPVVDASMKLVGLITLTDLLHAHLGVGPDGQAITKADATTPASAIMRRNVVTAHPDAPVATACRVMLHEKLGCLPIILDDAKLVGIVTQTDLVRLSLEYLER